MILYKKLIIISLVIIHARLHSSPGCIDSSWHLAKPNDDKSYHVVGRNVGNHEMHCPCPCTKLSLDRGQCLECRHRHVIPAMHIVRYDRNYDYSR